MNLMGKIISIVMIFAIIAGGAITSRIYTDSLRSERAILNEVTNFIDKVTDNGRITELDLSNFYLGVASHGVSVDASVKRYLKVVNPNGAGGTYTSYTLADTNVLYNKGDFVQVSVKGIDYTNGQKLMRYFLRMSPSKIDYTLAGRVRIEG